MSNKPQILWCAEKLYDLLSEYPNHTLLAKLRENCKTYVIDNESDFRNIKASPPPTMDDDTTASTDE